MEQHADSKSLGTTRRGENADPWRARLCASRMSAHTHASAATLRRFGCAKPQFFDTHLRIFNGTDLQIARFLSQSVAPEYPRATGIIRALAQPLQEFVWAFSPT